MKIERKHRQLMYICYGILLLIAYFVQFTPFMFKIHGVYPSPILILVIVIAMFEKEFCGAIFGLFAGMLTDINSQNGSGFHALTYLITGLVCSMLIEKLLQNNIISLITIGGPTLVLHSIIELLTKSSLTSGALQLYFSHYLAGAVYSFLVMILFYFFYALIFGFKLRYKQPAGILPKKIVQQKNNS